MHAERRVGTHGQRRPRVRPPGRRRPLPVRARLLPLRSSLRARSAVCHRTSLQALCAVPVWCHSCGFCVNAWWRLSFSAANSMPCHATHAFAQERCCMHPCKRPPPKYGSRLRPPPLAWTSKGCSAALTVHIPDSKAAPHGQGKHAAGQRAMEREGPSRRPCKNKGHYMLRA